MGVNLSDIERLTPIEYSDFLKAAEAHYLNDQIHNKVAATYGQSGGKKLAQAREKTLENTEKKRDIILNAGIDERAKEKAIAETKKRLRARGF